MIQKMKIIKIKSKYKNNSIFLKKNNIKKKKTKSNIKYLYYNKKLNQGLFLKTPTYKELSYPFIYNLKLISQYLKKK